MDECSLITIQIGWKLQLFDERVVFELFEQIFKVASFGRISLLLFVGDFFFSHSCSVTLSLEPSQVASELWVFVAVVIVIITITIFFLLFLELLSLRFAHFFCIFCYFGCVVSLRDSSLMRFLLDYSHSVTCSHIVVASVVECRTDLAMLLKVGT